MQNTEEFYTAAEVAEKLGCTKKILEAKLRAGEIIGSKRLGKWFILRSDLIRFIEEGRILPEQEEEERPAKPQRSVLFPTKKKRK